MAAVPVFPGEYVEPSRVTNTVAVDCSKRPLFILLDATWTEARKIFRKSPYFDRLPILSLLPDRLSRYRLRRSTRSEHLCTAEVAALCLELAGTAMRLRHWTRISMCSASITWAPNNSWT